MEAVLRRTLGSVVFGISVMALLAVYIALGSGVPRLREFFEMNELQFFSAWPLKVLSALLVMNLAVVTWTRIPFTLPRYGVWCIHAGVVVLVLGMAYHYALKTEGLTRIFLGQSVEHYYDMHERALYAKVGLRRALATPLPDLPRFSTYSEALGNASTLDRPSLRALAPLVPAGIDPSSGRPATRTLAEELGIPSLSIDVIGYHPYAVIRFDGFEQDPSIRNTGLRLTPRNIEAIEPRWLVGSEPGQNRISYENVELEHRHLPSADAVRTVSEASSRLHEIEVRIDEVVHKLFVEPGRAYAIEGTGYTLEPVSHVPNWTTIDRSWTGNALLLKVRRGGDGERPTAEFLRMVLDGPEVQTDFDPADRSAGPLGKRQPKPLDDRLLIRYRFNDSMRLLGPRSSERRLLLTCDDAPGVTQVIVGAARASEVTTVDFANPELSIAPAVGGPLAAPISRDVPRLILRVERFDHLRPRRSVVDVPREQRDRDAGASGVFQVVTLRLRSSDWTKVVHVPFEQWAADVAWESEPIEIPGARAPLELRLGNTVRGIPARIKLDRFELVPYPGGDASPGSIMRDFRSHLTITDCEGRSTPGVAQMNDPVYFASGDWLFYQAQWDPDGQKFTVLGVGNRPGVFTMTLGCVMIGVGLGWAFYVKPLLIKRMKRQALERAARAGHPAPAAATPVLH